MPLFDQRIATLILKHLKGQLTHEEAEELHQWLQSDENRQLFENLTHEETLKAEVENFSIAKDSTWAILTEKVQQEKVVSIYKRTFKTRIVAAAAVFILLAGGAYWYASSTKTVTQEVAVAEPRTLEDVKPGTTKAILTLADGRTVILDQAEDGTLLVEDGVKVIKLRDGQLLYQLTGSDKLPAGSAIAYNKISTPKGGQHKVLLSDGTQVWLNASSSISYPVSFTNLKERKVIITGEAYFEVARAVDKDKKKIPFIVDVAGKGAVEVLGTHFNINAYPDEETINTTLLEGSVKVQSGANSNILKPGQQAQLNAIGKLTVSNNVNIDQVMAWKNGKFVFKSATLETILKQASRWYDVDIVYANGKPADKFSGPIPMNYNLAEFFKVLQYSDVNIKLEEGRRLVISQ